MNLSQAKAQIAKAINRKNMLVVVGDCHVEYFGRAASKLPKGTRMLLIKGDSSFAIHQNKNLRPVNYMMNASVHSELKDGVLMLHAMKRKPKEDLKVFFHSIEDINSYEIQETSDLRLFGSEKELSNELMQDLSFIEPGLKPINQEEMFRKGVVDIIAEDTKGNLVVIEVKRRQAGFNAVTQLQRYMKQVENIKGKKTRGILIAPEIRKNALELLENYGLEFAKLEFEIGNPKATIKGVERKQKTINECFKL